MHLSNGHHPATIRLRGVVTQSAARKSLGGLLPCPIGSHSSSTPPFCRLLGRDLDIFDLEMAA